MNFKTKFNRTLVAALIGALLAGGVGLMLHVFPVGVGLINLSYDLLLVARGDVAAQEAVMVVLDEKSHLELNQSQTAPWDRSLHARLIERLTAAGARAIVFDVVFSDPDPTNPSGDERLANAMKQSGRVILAADNVPNGPKQYKAVPPFELLRNSAATFGSAEVRPSSDLTIREHTPEDQLPSLSWAAAEFIGVKATQQDSVRHAPRWMNYYGPPNSIRWKSYHEALYPARVSDDFFRDKVVFVGARVFTKFVGERKDEFPNPFSFWLSRKMVEERGSLFSSGVEIQATAFLNLLRGDWLARLSLSTERVVILLLGALFGFGLIRYRPVIATGIAVAGLALAAIFFYLLFVNKLTWFPWLIVAVQIVVALFWSVIFNSIQLYVQKRLYEYTLRLYLSPKLVKKFSSDPTLLKPGAEELTLTIFFSDIANFTSLSQGMSSDALAKLMNQYFHTAVADCIHKTDGTVVKYIGDGIFSFWNAPESQTDHQMRACEAALHFRDLGEQRVNGQLLVTRIGIHTGLARVGNFGSLDRVDYTALGESVNLASRLEGLNKYLGTECLISRETKAGVGDRLVTRALGSFQLKGFENSVEVHELVGWPDEAEATRPWRETFAQALNNYEQRNLEFAELGFRHTLELRPDDGPAKFYLNRLEELRTQTLPEDWATHTVLREK